MNRMRLGLVMAGLAVLAALPAQARPQDAVMSGAYRCNVIADDRQWLDCYYGAAQPLRARLGLTPAPDAQIRLAMVPPEGGDSRSRAVRDQALASAAGCNAAADDRQWLNCYYAAVLPVRALLGLSRPPNAVPAAPVIASANPAFAVKKPAPSHGDGFADWLAGSDNARIVSRLKSYSFDTYGIFTVTLENGQVWRQQSGDTSYAHWRKPAASYTATLTRGALGSIDLRVKGQPGGFKVSRLQ